MAAIDPVNGPEGHTGPWDWLRANEEKVRLVGYLSVMVGLGVPLASLLSRGYDSAATGTATGFLLETITGLGPGLVTLEAFMLGVLLSLVTLLTLDDKKYVQGILLWIGLVTLGVGFLVVGFYPRILLQVWGHAGYILAGVIAGLTLAVPRPVLRSALRFETPRQKEFRRAPRLLYALIAGTVILLYLEYHLTYPPVFSAETVGQATFGIRTNHLFVDTVAATGFVMTTRQFMQYEAQIDVAVFGHSGNGKSTYAYGSLTEYLNRVEPHVDVPPMNISQDLYELMGHAENAAVDIDAHGVPVGEWFIPNNLQGDIEEYVWTIRDGEIFPTNLRTRIVDYAGENFRAFVEALTGTPIDELSSGDPEVVRHLRELAESANTILLLVDVEALVDEDDTLDAHLYSDIIDEYAGQKEVYLVATKADLLDQRFRERTGRDPYDIGNIERYTEFVTDEVCRRSKVVRRFTNEIGADRVYPVYVRTIETDDRRRPVVTDDGDYQPFGYVQLLEALK